MATSQRRTGIDDGRERTISDAFSRDTLTGGLKQGVIKTMIPRETPNKTIQFFP